MGCPGGSEEDWLVVYGSLPGCFDLFGVDVSGLAGDDLALAPGRANALAAVLEFAERWILEHKRPNLFDAIHQRTVSQSETGICPQSAGLDWAGEPPWAGNRTYLVDRVVSGQVSLGVALVL